MEKKPNSTRSMNNDELSWKHNLEKIRLSVETGYDFSLITNLMRAIERAAILLFTALISSIYLVVQKNDPSIKVFGFILDRLFSTAALSVLITIFWLQIAQVLSALKIIIAKVDKTHFNDSVLLIRADGGFLNPFSLSAIPVMYFNQILCASWVALMYININTFYGPNKLLNILIFGLTTVSSIVLFVVVVRLKEIYNILDPKPLDVNRLLIRKFYFWSPLILVGIYLANEKM